MTNNLATRQLGNTALHLTELGFGGASLGNLYRPVSDEETGQTVRATLDCGMNYFDTAPYYGLGLSERRLGDQLRNAGGQKIILSTKVGRLLRPDPGADTTALRHGFATPMPFDVHYDYSYDGIMRSHEDSLQRLGLASVDILLVHDIGRLTHGSEHQRHFDDFVNSGYRALDELRAAGNIKAVGLGVNEWEICDELMAYGQFDCFLLAGRYTLLEQDALDAFFPACARHGASIILGGAYNSGILATGTHGNLVPTYNYRPAPREVLDRVQSIEQICTQHGVTLAAAALQFPLAHPVVTCVIPGLSSAQRVDSTMKLFAEVIPGQFWRDLKAAGLIQQEAPVPSAGVGS